MKVALPALALSLNPMNPPLARAEAPWLVKMPSPAVALLKKLIAAPSPNLPMLPFVTTISDAARPLSRQHDVNRGETARVDRNGNAVNGSSVVILSEPASFGH